MVVLRQLRQDRVAMISTVVLAIIISAAIFAPWIAPADPFKASMMNRLLPIGSPGHWLGTDELGRDMLTRLMYDGRLSLLMGVVPVLGTGIMAGLRMIKDPAEIDALRAAGAAIDRVHAKVPEFLRPGRTEAEVAADITEAIVAEGHSGAAFVIVGSGPNGADPHHECSDRELQPGDVVVVDIGGPVEPGYNSDCTRTYSLGRPAAEIAEQYAVLQRAQAAAVAAVRPGVRAEEVDAAARDVLADAGLAEYFVHRTGHGIGLSVHEEPYIVAGNDLPLVEGMAFSVEPGIYLPGRWGARIEDIVIVTADGALSVNGRPHALTVV